MLKAQECVKLPHKSHGIQQRHTVCILGIHTIHNSPPFVKTLWRPFYPTWVMCFPATEEKYIYRNGKLQNWIKAVKEKDLPPPKKNPTPGKITLETHAMQPINTKTLSIPSFFTI